MKTFKIILTVIVLMLNIYYSNAQAYPPTDTAYQLVWADSFNYTGPEIDNSKWLQRWTWNIGDTILPFCPDPDVDRTKVAYWRWYQSTPDDRIDTNNSKVKNGILSLITKKENFSGSCWNWPACTNSDPDLATKCNGDGGICGVDIPGKCWNIGNRTFRYTTGMLLSKYKFKYGYFEMKFKIPLRPTSPAKWSTGPNFWLWAGGDSAVPYSEIDIFEINAINGVYKSNVHYIHAPHDPSAYNTINQQSVGYLINDSAWHIAGMLWTSDQINYYKDGALIHSITKDSVRIDSLLPMNMIVDVNAPARNYCQAFDQLSQFPYTFYVDYVKVWQLKPWNGCTKNANIYCGNFNPAAYGKSYKYVEFDGSTCVDALTNINYTQALGEKYVTLSQGFSIDNNSTMLINSKGCTSVLQQNISGIGPPPSAYQRKLKENIE